MASANNTRSPYALLMPDRVNMNRQSKLQSPESKVQSLKSKVGRRRAGSSFAGSRRRQSALLLRCSERMRRLTSAASVPGRGLVYRDERFPTGACDANRSRTARSEPQGTGAKGPEANVRPKEHKWAVRQATGGEQASTSEARESSTALCRARGANGKTGTDPGRSPG